MNQILCGDACRLLTRLPTQSVDRFHFSALRQSTSKAISQHATGSVCGLVYPDCGRTPARFKTDRHVYPKYQRERRERRTLPYVLQLILALREQGWLWTEEFIWHKKNSVPGKWPNRLRDGWERLLQFNQQKKFCMYQEAVMIPIHPSTVGRLKRLKAADKVLMSMKTGSPFKRNLSHWLNKDKVYPCNVLHLATESHNQRHCAAFPESLPPGLFNYLLKKMI